MTKTRTAPKVITCPVSPKPYRHRGELRCEKTTVALTAEIVPGVSLRIRGEIDGERRVGGYVLAVSVTASWASRDYALKSWLASLTPAQRAEGGALKWATHGFSRQAEAAVFRDWLADHDFPASAVPDDLYVIEEVEVPRIPYDRTWHLGDYAESGSYNLSYYGTISAITAKTVEITDDGCERRKRRLDLWRFWRHNRDWSLAVAQKRNSEWMD